MDRPSTSKPRGVCKYYLEPRGCFAGDRCKFLHCNPDEETAVTLTPYDQAKKCRFYAKGFCKRGDKCWFLHEFEFPNDMQAEKRDEEEDPIDALCSICLERPHTYGLLGGCSHVFCIECIRQWRSRTGKTFDVVESGVTKKCPMCRSESRFITPSSIFYKQGDIAKDAAIATYMESMARVPCRYFQASKEKRGRPSCPFGKDCFYQHRNDDGTAHVMDAGVAASMRSHFSPARTNVLSRRQVSIPFDNMAMMDELFAHASNTLVESLNEVDSWLFEERGRMRRAEEGLGLIEDLLSSLNYSPDGPLEWIGGGDPDRTANEAEVPPPLEPIALDDDHDSDDTMPALRDIESSSDEMFSDSASNSDSEEEEWEDAPQGLSTSAPSQRPSNEAVPVGRFAQTEEHQEMVIEVDDEELQAEEADKPREGGPPFLTDGRGRVIGTNEEETSSPSFLSRLINGVFGI